MTAEERKAYIAARLEAARALIAAGLAAAAVAIDPNVTLPTPPVDETTPVEGGN